MTHIEFHGKVKTLRHEPVCFIEGIAKKASVQNGLRKERNMGGEVRWCRVPQRRWKWWRSTELEWFNTIYVWKEGFPGGARDKEPTCQCRRHKETLVWSLVLEDPLEEGNVTHSSILVWRIPWTEEPDGLQSTGSQTIRQDWSNLTCKHAYLKWLLWTHICK